MKKTIFPLACLALVMASCSNDDFSPSEGQGDALTFTVNIPAQMESRAYGEATSATYVLSYAAYEDGQTTPVVMAEDVPGNGLEFKVTMNLAKGKTYDFVFWADNGTTSPYEFKADGQTVTVSYDGAKVNDDTRDAFFNSVKGITVNGPIQRTVELRRPFAQVNVGTSDLEAASNVGIKLANTALTVEGAYTELNLFTGVAEKTTTATFAAAPVSDEPFPYESGKYDYLAMAYVLTGTEIDGGDVHQAQSELFDIEVTMTMEDGHEEKIPVDNAPVQRNYRTNIFGALLTTPMDWTIVIEPDLNTPDNKAEFDSERYRVAYTLDEAKALLAKGAEAVVLDGNLLTATSRAGNAVEFLLNKSAKLQKLKINGKASADIRVAYGELEEGATEAEKPEFTLVITNSANNVEVDLDGASVKVEGRVDDKGNKATIANIDITNAAAANVDGTVAVEQITPGDAFEGDVDFTGDVTLSVATADDFVAALTSEGVSEINVKTDIDLTVATLEQLTVAGKKAVNLSKGITIKVGHEVYFSVSDDFTLIGNATITNELEDKVSGQVPNGKSLFVVTAGDFIARNVTLINDRDYHYHGPTMNSTAIGYYPETNITMDSVKIYSGEFAICCYNRTTGNLKSVVNLTDCHLESNSSYDYSTNSWSYAARISGKKALLKNCTVVGIQGALSPDYVEELTIDGGDYSTHYLDPDKKTGNPFSALYVTGGSRVTILGGKFWSPIAKYCVRAGDNDVDSPTGQIVIKGGKYNYKPWNTSTTKTYEPAAGLKYADNTGDDADRYPIVVVAE